MIDEIEKLEAALESHKPSYERAKESQRKFYGMNKDRPSDSGSMIYEAAQAHLEQMKKANKETPPRKEQRLIWETLTLWMRVNGTFSYAFKQGVEWGVSRAVRDKK